ncbi:hypothetical protein HZS_8162 [Henneguya salminicola]|nr:hypothetical protein HZS_8162 [Henneguya salminicola]
MPGTKYDSKQRATVRNLRIREDTAKYLYNLDEKSAFYDPKSRSMRENPLKDILKGQNISFKGDILDPNSGEIIAVADATSLYIFILILAFTLSAYEKGVDVHLLADPTKAELLMKQFKARKEALNVDHQKELISKYGGEEHLFAPPKEMLLDQTEDYVEYSRTGKIIKGQERAPIRSKYIEDVYINNHTSGWGSYWSDFQWGYTCCHSFIKNSYCTGLLTESIPQPTAISTENTDLNECVIETDKTEFKRKLNLHHQQIIANSPPHQKKSKYHVIHETPLPTKNEMEDYKLKKQRSGDPLPKYNKS